MGLINISGNRVSVASANIHNGTKIKPPAPGKIPGRRWANDVTNGLNGLLTQEVKTTDSETGKVTISDTKTVIEVPVGKRGGGSGGSTSIRMRVIEVHGDYLICYVIGIDDEVVELPIVVAKPPQLRHSIANLTIEGVACAFTYDTRSGNLDGKRVVTATGKLDQTEIVIPVYYADDSSQAEIWADAPSGGVGEIFDDEGDPLDDQPIYMDTNRDARAWCQII